MQYPLSEVFPCLDTGPASCPCQEDLCWPHINSVPAPPSALLAGPQVSSVLASTSLLGVGDHHLCSRPLLWPAVHCNIQLLYQFNAWELTPASPEIWSLPLYFLMSSSSRVEQYFYLGLLTEIFNCQTHQTKEKLFLPLYEFAEQSPSCPAAVLYQRKYGHLLKNPAWWVQWWHQSLWYRPRDSWGAAGHLLMWNCELLQHHHGLQLRLEETQTLADTERGLPDHCIWGNTALRETSAMAEGNKVKTTYAQGSTEVL